MPPIRVTFLRATAHGPRGRHGGDGGALARLCGRNLDGCTSQSARYRPGGGRCGGARHRRCGHRGPREGGATRRTGSPWKARELPGRDPGRDRGSSARRSTAASPRTSRARRASSPSSSPTHGSRRAGCSRARTRRRTTAGQSLTPAPGSWQEVTTAPYNSDDTRYKDYYSNSGAGSGVRQRAAAGRGRRPGRMRLRGGRGGWRDAVEVGHRRGGSRSATASPPRPAATSRSSTARSGTPPVTRPPARRPMWATVSMPRAPWGPSPTRARSAASELDGDTILSITKSGNRIVRRRRVRRLVRTAPTWRTTAGDPWTREFAPHPEYLPGGAKQFDASSRDSEHRLRRDRRPEAGRSPARRRSAGCDGADYNGWYETDAERHHGRGSSRRVRSRTCSSARRPSSTRADGSTLYAARPDADHQGQRVLLLGAAGCLRVEQRLVHRPVEQDRRQRRSSPTPGSALKAQVPHVGCTSRGYQPGRPGLVQPVPRRRPGEPGARVRRASRRSTRRTNGGAPGGTIGPYWNFCFPCWTPSTRDRAERAAR